MADAHQAIDIHTHIMPPGWEDFGARFGIPDWPSARMHDSCNATIMIGSDYPFDMGVDHPLEQLDGVALSPEDFENVTHRAAEAFLGMRAAK